MGKSLKYLADNLIISPNCERRQLNLSHSDAAPLREMDIFLASTCNVYYKCEVKRRDPNFHILIFSLEGPARLFTAQFPRKGKTIEPGHIVILPAHNAHHYKMTGQNWKAIWFYLADTDTWRQLKDTQPHIRVSVTCDELRSAMEGFWAESLRKEARARSAARHYAEVMVLNLERELDMEESPSNREMRQRLYKLWDTVSANLGRNWSVAELANEVCISPQHLYRVSHHFCGHKPMEMVTLLRMRQAKELLINTNNLVKEIARLLGYSDAFSFSAAFKKYAGCSPSEFRKQNQQEYIENEKRGQSSDKVNSKKGKK